MSTSDRICRLAFRAHMTALSQLPPAAPGRGATISACLGASVKNENLDGSCLPEWHQLSLSWLAGNL